MPDEVMKDFIEQVIECVEGISDAFQLLLQHYHVNVAEQESCQEQSDISINQLKEVLIEKTQEGKKDKIQQLLLLFRAEKLSEIRTEDYKAFYRMVQDI